MTTQIVTWLSLKQKVKFFHKIFYGIDYIFDTKSSTSQNSDISQNSEISQNSDTFLASQKCHYYERAQ